VTESNAQRARRGFDAALRGDRAELQELLDPDVRWHGGGPQAGCQNRREALDRIDYARRHRTQLAEVIEAGDTVVLVLRRPAGNGKPDELVANVATFRGGRTAEMVHCDDVEAALAAARRL
jgi:ketosteroid isomerase-like protein